MTASATIQQCFYEHGRDFLGYFVCCVAATVDRRLRSFVRQDGAVIKITGYARRFPPPWSIICPARESDARTAFRRRLVRDNRISSANSAFGPNSPRL
jgi:hypothetical protein